MTYFGGGFGSWIFKKDFGILNLESPVEYCLHSLNFKSNGADSSSESSSSGASSAASGISLPSSCGIGVGGISSSSSVLSGFWGTCGVEGATGTALKGGGVEGGGDEHRLVLLGGEQPVVDPAPSVRGLGGGDGAWSAG